MKLWIIAVSQKQPGWVSEAYTAYEKRMPRHLPLQLIEVKPALRSEGRSASQLQLIECERIRGVLPKGARSVVLDERGAAWSTLNLADAIANWQRDGRDVAFVVGGADGLDASFKKAADHCLSVSSMTLPHGLVRILLSEQVYRAISLMQNHPYHRS